MLKKIAYSFLFLFLCAQSAFAASAVNPVELTWMSIANWYIKIGDTKIMMDAYITRVPGPPFFYAPKNLPEDPYAFTTKSYGVDTASIKKVKDAVLGKGALDYMMVGHSHFDHSWDAPMWSKLTGAKMIGGVSTCLQAEAQGVKTSQCQSVSGGEKIALNDNTDVFVVRFNHSGNNKNPIQHFARELYQPPTPDAKGQYRAGVGEDYPNGGGNRAYLFVVNTDKGKVSFFINSSASAYDLDKDIIVDGVNYGSPIEDLKMAMKAAGLDKVDVWIGAGGKPVAELVVPVLHPKVYIPHHWDGLFNSFWKGIPYPYKDNDLADYLKREAIELIPQKQYFDSYSLSATGTHLTANHSVKAKLGFHDEQKFSATMLNSIKHMASTTAGDDCGETVIRPSILSIILALNLFIK